MKYRILYFILLLTFIFLKISAQEQLTSAKIQPVKIIYENYNYFIADSITGKHIKSLNYDKVWDFYGGFACVELFNKWGYIDFTGKEIVPPKYDKVYNFSEGRAPVNVGRKWGFIDKSGKEIIPIIYESVLGFSKGVACVTFEGRIYNIDKNGNEVNP